MLQSLGCEATSIGENLLLVSMIVVCEVRDDPLCRDRGLQQDTSKLVQPATLLRKSPCDLDVSCPRQ